MHPIFARKGRLALYLITWIPAAGLLAALLAGPGSLAWPESVALAGPLCLLYAFLCLSGWYLCRAFPLETGVLKLVVIHATAAFLSGSLWVLMGRLWAGVLSWFAFHGAGERYAAQVPTVAMLTFGALVFMLAVLGHYLLAVFEVADEAERRSFHLRVLAREAELKALRAQIDPHFLFDCLNFISALITVDPTGSRKMCLLLSDFLRKSLQLGAEEVVSLDQEVKLISSFLQIEQVRLGPRLRVTVDVDAGAADCLLPPFLLQPLVENALRHGIAHLVEGGNVVVEARRVGERLLISVSNPCDPDRPQRSGKGIGLENVRNRLSALYGQQARLHAAGSPEHFRVDLSLPARVQRSISRGRGQTRL
jgi:two-component system, LytTR family, sensor histidine kinase AlgZ